MNMLMIRAIAFLLTLSVLLPVGRSQTLEEAFRNSPDSSRPWCYWYWISDNVSKEGITKDLEAMARVGIGTALIGNQWFKDQPQGDIPVLSDNWWDLTLHAIREGRRTGVDIGMFNCPGWSQSGGPWVKPEQSMRYLASSEMRVSGPVKFSKAIPAPGAEFQDVAVLAIPTPAGEGQLLSAREPKITVRPLIKNVAALFDGDQDTATAIPSGAKNPRLSIDVTLGEPMTARSVVFTPGPGNFRAEIEIHAWIEGHYVKVRDVKYDRRNPKVNVGPMPQGPVVASLPPTTSNRFRLVFAPRIGAGQLAEIEISPAARVELAIEKQLGKVHPTPTPLWGDYLWPEMPEPGDPSFTIDARNVVNLTDRLDADGRLTWDVPEGEWVLQRIGMLPTGTENSPAAPYATGPEVDKLNRQHLASHFDVFIGELLRRLPSEDRPAFKYVVADSYEMGPQNWTDGMRESFERAYGYDAFPYLPVLSGRIVNSADASDRFLWDLRRLVADRVADEYVGGLRDLCHEHGLKMWLENYGHWGFPGEFMRYGGECDLIGGEFWVTGTLGNIECRAAASTAHAYGKGTVYGEAFTSGDNWVYSPFDLKARGDWAFTEGINHFVLHVYIHQPSDDFVPGMNAWFGTEFNRHNTWFAEGKDWVDYLRRCHVMLKQGVHVGDFAYFIGEDTPIMTGTRQPEQPAGYDFDFINAEVLQERIDVRDGRWALPDGKSYAVLVLPPLKTMRPDLLNRLSQLVAAGGVLYGEAPTHSPSLQDAPRCDSRVAKLTQAMWQGMQAGETDDRKFGNGQIFQGGGLQRVVDVLGIKPDVSEVDPATLLWTHRQTPDMDIYFVSNQKQESVDLAPVFRCGGSQVPEVWYAESGKVEVRGCWNATDKGIRVPLHLAPAGSVFVVFRDNTQTPGPSVTSIRGPGAVKITAGESGWQADFDTGGQYSLARADGARNTFTVEPPPAPLQLAGPWKLRFMPGRDVPKVVELDTPRLWTDIEDEAIRHYSGTATYYTTFQVPDKRLLTDSLRHRLELERASPMARVILNGEDLGLLWHPPFHVDVTDALQPGENRLEVRVTNLWSNRLLGELKYPKGFPASEGRQEFHAKNSIPGRLNAKRPLQPSGLEAPVRIRSIRRVVITE